MFLSGFYHAIILVILSALSNVLMKIYVSVYDINGFMFSCIAMVSASLVLSIYAGPGRLVRESFKDISTWIYGFLAIVGFILCMTISKYISATELSLFERMAIPFSILAAYLFLKRLPTKVDFIGALIVTISTIYLLFIQNINYIHIISLLIVFAGVLQVAEYMVTEIHSESNQAQKTGTIRDKARVVGFVSFITSIIFLIFVFTISLINTKYFNGDPPEILNFIPNLDKLMDFKSVIVGLIHGALLTALFSYSMWSATYKMKSENVFALLVFVPILTIIFERFAAVFYPELQISLFNSTRGHELLALTILMTIGSGIPIFYKFKKEADKNPEKTFWDVIKTSFGSEKEEITMTSSAEGDYEIVKQTLGYTNGSYEKAAELLNLTSDIVKVLELGKGAYALKDEASVMINQNFRVNVMNKDSLTGLKNRGYINAKLKELIEKEKKFNIYFIDLNKFKPINDKYGHEVGDLVLKEVSNRLKTTFKEEEVARLGGDERSEPYKNKSITNGFILGYDAETEQSEGPQRGEFANEQTNQFIIIEELSDKKPQAKAQETKDKIEKTINGSLGITILDEELKVSGTIGYATYPANGKTPKDLLKHADTDMYKNKKIIE